MLVFKNPKHSSWSFFLTPDLYSDQNDADLYFAEEKQALYKPEVECGFKPQKPFY